LVNEIALGLAREQIAVQEEENARELVPDRRQSWHRPLARISHRFCQNQPEAADSLNSPHRSEKQCVWKARSAAPQYPGIPLVQAQAGCCL
jgi:hypothetical protein